MNPSSPPAHRGREKEVERSRLLFSRDRPAAGRRVELLQPIGDLVDRRAQARADPAIQLGLAAAPGRRRLALRVAGAVLAAQAMGADFAYIGSAFIATQEARAVDAYKQAVVDGNSDDIVYSNLFTGVHGNYLAPSIRAMGLDPDKLPESDPSKMNFGGDAKKAWKDIWGCGQGIGAIKEIQSTADLVAQKLTEWGIPIHRGMGKTGVVGILKCGSGDRAAFADQAHYRLAPPGHRDNIAETGPHQGGHPGAYSESHPFVPHVLHDFFAGLGIEAASCEERSTSVSSMRRINFPPRCLAKM